MQPSWLVSRSIYRVQGASIHWTCNRSFTVSELIMNLHFDILQLDLLPNPDRIEYEAWAWSLKPEGPPPTHKKANKVRIQRSRFIQLFVRSNQSSTYKPSKLSWWNFSPLYSSQLVSSASFWLALLLTNVQHKTFFTPSPGCLTQLRNLTNFSLCSLPPEVLPVQSYVSFPEILPVKWVSVY